MKIYLPEITNQCYSVIDANTIRSYDTLPQNGITVSYTDIYINSHYLQKQGQQVFADVEVLPQCLLQNQLTTNWYYRNDIADILFIISVFSVFCFYIPLKLILRLFKRFN